ncbi:MAG: DeoR family transcriptional regulator [Patescibacteria group bacterium]
MSDSEQAEQGEVSATSSPTPGDAPAPEAVPAEVVVAPPASADAVPAVSIDEATSVAPSAPRADSPANSPAESPVPEHTNILEADRADIGTCRRNVGMSSNADNANSAPTPSVQGNGSPPALPPTEPSAPAGGTAYAALLSLRDKALNAIQFRRRARLEKIIALAEKNGSIGNDDVEKLLRVSDATVSRYLSELVRDGKLKRAGHAKAIRYSLPIAPSTGGDIDPIASNGAV